MIWKNFHFIIVSVCVSAVIGIMGSWQGRASVRAARKTQHNF